MIKNYLPWLLTLLFCAAFVSCRHIPPPPPPAPVVVKGKTDVSYQPLTYALLKEIEKQAAKNGKTISDIKFYLSSDVTLLNNDSNSEIDIITDTSNQDRYGAVYRSKTQSYDAIVISKNLAGFYMNEPIYVPRKDGRIVLGISFDPDSNDLLYFTQNINNELCFFYLQPADNNSIMRFSNANNDYESLLRIKYRGKEYLASFNSTDIPHLMIQVFEESIPFGRNVTKLQGHRVKPGTDGQEEESINLNLKDKNQSAFTMGYFNE
jgi:hypothetical protein